jgi:hypothetical protein
MRYCLVALFFIIPIVCESASAQNLNRLVTTSSTSSTNTQSEINLESPLVSIETVEVRPRLFPYTLPPLSGKKSLLKRAEEIVQNAYFQRKRFDETGQPIEIDRDHIYYRRDAYSYTKGIILYNFFSKRMDVGVYRSHFSPATTLISGRLQPDFGQGSSNALLFRNNGRVFFSVRMKLP